MSQPQVGMTILPGCPVSVTDGKINSTFVNDATSVPATTVRVQGVAFTQTDPPSVYVCPIPAGGAADQTTSRVNGRRIRGDGALVIAPSGTPASYIDGLPFDSTGRLCAEVAAPASYYEGVGLSSGGLVCLSAVS